LADAATADSLADITTTSAHAKLRRLLLRFSANAFSIAMNPGAAAATDLETVLTDLANMLAGTTGITTFPSSAKAADGVSLAEVIRYIQETNDDLVDASNDEVTLVQAFNTTTTTINDSITLFALSAWDGPRKDVKVEFWLDADGAATFTPAFYVTRAGAPTTFVVRSIPAIATIATPGAVARYEYEYGDLGQGDRLEFRVAQDNNGDATNAIDGTLTYVR